LKIAADRGTVGDAAIIARIVGANEPVGGGLDVGRAIDVVMNPAVSRPPMQPIEWRTS